MPHSFTSLHVFHSGRKLSCILIESHTHSCHHRTWLCCQTSPSGISKGGCLFPPMLSPSLQVPLRTVSLEVQIHGSHSPCNRSLAGMCHWHLNLVLPLLSTGFSSSAAFPPGQRKPGPPRLSYSPTPVTERSPNLLDLHLLNTPGVQLPCSLLPSQCKPLSPLKQTLTICSPGLPRPSGALSPSGPHKALLHVQHRDRITSPQDPRIHDFAHRVKPELLSQLCKAFSNLSTLQSPSDPK